MNEGIKRTGNSAANAFRRIDSARRDHKSISYIEIVFPSAFQKAEET
jgi:hypothetical protein